MSPVDRPRRPRILSKTDLRRSHLAKSRQAMWEITDATGRTESDSELDRILFDGPAREAEWDEPVGER